MAIKKKRKLKVRNIVMMFVLLCIVGISVYFIIDNLDPYKEKYFIEKGYETSEVEFILTLDNDEKDKILEQDRIENIVKHYTLDDYTELLNIGYTDEEVDQILLLDDETKQIVLNHSKIENLIEWLEYDNFIITKLDRYLEHSNKKPNIELSLIIEQVNTNRDYAYYTNISEANIELNELMLVNKYYVLDDGYVPDNLSSISPYGSVKLTKQAAEAFIDLCEDAKDLGYTIMGISGYRSYQTQANLYDRYLQKDPQSVVDTYSARPGHSEHQTGLVIDVSSNNANILTFEMSNSFKWMKDNAHNYGFILRYPKNKEDITGYKYEPWHYRYVGKEIATILYETGMTFDEYVALNLID